MKSTSAKVPCPAASARPMPESAGMFRTITNTNNAVNETIVPMMIDENAIQPPVFGQSRDRLLYVAKLGLPV